MRRRSGPGEQTVVAEGLANVTTRAPMTEDTGYLCGSITKVIDNDACCFKCVERGQADLDERVTSLPPWAGRDPPLPPLPPLEPGGCCQHG